MEMKKCMSWNAATSLAIALLIMGPLVAVTSAMPLQKVRMQQIADLFVPDPLFVDTIGLFQDTLGITTFFEQATYLNAQAIITTVDRTADRITSGSNITIGSEVSGSATATMSRQGITAGMSLYDQGGEQWTSMLDSVVEIEEGFQLRGFFIHSVDGVATQEPFEAILGFDGELTLVGDVENLEILVESMVGHVVLGERSVVLVVVVAIVVVLLLIIILTQGCRWYNLFCDASQHTIEFPAMDRRLASLPYAIVA